MGGEGWGVGDWKGRQIVAGSLGLAVAELGRYPNTISKGPDGPCAGARSDVSLGEVSRRTHLISFLSQLL